MEILQYIFMQIIAEFFGANVYYVYCKLRGDKRKYFEIKKNISDYIKLWLGSITIIIIIILVKKIVDINHW